MFPSTYIFKKKYRNSNLNTHILQQLCNRTNDTLATHRFVNTPKSHYHLLRAQLKLLRYNCFKMLPFHKFYFSKQITCYGEHPPPPKKERSIYITFSLSPKSLRGTLSKNNKTSFILDLTSCYPVIKYFFIVTLLGQ